MFPPNNFDPESQSWVRAVQDSLTLAETEQPRIDASLDALQRESNSVLTEVSSNVNNYYTSTLAQYPAFQRTFLMSDVLGGRTKTVGIAAPAAANQDAAETWVSIFTYDFTLPSAKTLFGIRLNSAQFRLNGPTGYYLRFRWRVNAFNEGINTNRWLSRHSFNLGTYTMDPTNPTLTNVTNRYVHYSDGSVTTATIELQATIESISNRSASVASQNVTFEAFDNNGNDTYLDVMVTV